MNDERTIKQKFIDSLPLFGIMSFFPDDTIFEFLYFDTMKNLGMPQEEIELRWKKVKKEIRLKTLAVLVFTFFVMAISTYAYFSILRP